MRPVCFCSRNIEEKTDQPHACFVFEKTSGNSPLRILLNNLSVNNWVEKWLILRLAVDKASQKGDLIL